MSRYVRLGVGFLILLSVAALQPQTSPAQAADTNSRQFVVYTQYNPTFVPGKSKLFFTVTAYLQNGTSKDYKNVEILRSFPEGFEVRTVPDAVQAVVSRPSEFRQGIDANQYTMFLPEIWGGRGASVFYEVHPKARFDQVMLPGLEIAFDLEETRLNTTTSGDLLQFKPYTYFSGSLRDFLKRNAQVAMNFETKGDAWRMAPIDFKASGRNPAGITGISGDLTEGHFRLQAGLPGNFRDLLVVWWPNRKKDRVQAEEEFRKLVKKYSSWVGLRQLIDDSVKVKTNHMFKKFRGWYAQGLWRDDVPERYGEGPFSSALMYSSVSKAEYLLFWWAQGRGMGLGRSDVPQPARDAALMKQLDGIVNSFRPFRKH